jgi:serine/threonine protein kinase
MHDESGVDQSLSDSQEYEIAHRLRHASIVHCHELGVADDHAYLAMEHSRGRPAARIRTRSLPAEALELSAQIVNALSACTPGTLHRDLKPERITMRGTGHIA